MFRNRGGTDIFKLVGTIKSENDLFLEGSILKQAPKVGFKLYSFYLTNKGTLYILDFMKKKYETYKLLEKYSLYQRKYLDKYPYTILIDEELFISFKSPSTYFNFIKFLKKNNFKEKESPLAEYTSRLDNLDIINWKSDDVIEWLSHLMYNGEPICLLYEEHFVSKDFDGGQLISLSEKDLLDMGISEEHTKFINFEKKKLISLSVFKPNKTRFRMKLEQLGFEKEPKNFLIKDEEMLFSLVDEIEMSDTYLTLENHELLHKKAEEIDSKEDLYEIRVILTEFPHNSKSYETEQNFYGTIEQIPKKFDWESKFGKFKCGVIVGPWYLEFGNNSFCVPKRMHPVIREMYHEIGTICKIQNTAEEIRDIIAPIIASWNARSIYRSIEPDLKNHQGNCQTFVDDILKKFKCNKLKGSLNSIMNEIKDFGDGGASIYPAENAFAISSKFGFSDLPEITNHQDLDDDLLAIMEQDSDFPKNFPHDFIAFQLIDLSFWFRSMVTDNVDYEELLSIKLTPLCPCFQRKLFEDVFALDTDYNPIVREETKPKYVSKKSHKSLMQRKTFNAKSTASETATRIKSETPLKTLRRTNTVMKLGGISQLGRKLTVFIKKK
eukprot:gene5621-9438_t